MKRTVKIHVHVPGREEPDIYQVEPNNYTDLSRDGVLKIAIRQDDWRAVIIGLPFEIWESEP